MKTRNSSIELLKILAMVIIIISHSIPFGTFKNYDSFINLNICSINIVNLLLSIFRYLGAIGNCLFIICSCYFLIDKDKIRIDKIIQLVMDTTLISLIIMVIFRFCFNINYAFSTKELIKMCFPIIFSSYWFINAYIIFYLLIPVLNKVISFFNKKSHFIWLVALLCLATLNTLKTGMFYFNDLIAFIFIYFFVSYIKKYYSLFEKNMKINFILCVCSLLTLLLSIIMVNYFGMHISLLHDKLLLFNKFYNPLIVLFCYCLFNIFNNRSFNSKVINYLSSLSLLIYLIHGHQFVVGFLKGKYYDYLAVNYGFNDFIIVIYSLVLTTLFVIGSILLSILYDGIRRFLHRNVHSFSVFEKHK